MIFLGDLYTITNYDMRFEVLVLYYLRPPFSLQGHSANVAVSKLMDSVLGTVKPLFSRASDGSQSLLSPASERSTGLLLELALEIGIVVN